MAIMWLEKEQAAAKQATCSILNFATHFPGSVIKQNASNHNSAQFHIYERLELVSEFCQMLSITVTLSEKISVSLPRLN